MLVALLRDKVDLSILLHQLWYRIPVQSAPPCLDKVTHIAFYQTSVFQNEKWLVQYFGKIKKITGVKRKKLFPTEPQNPKSDNLYFKIELESLEKLQKPIISKRGRRITFIPTTFEKFTYAEEINDLFHDSPLEDKLWKELKNVGIEAERQFLINDDRTYYFLDFALLCKKKNVDVECDGDAWHITKEIAIKDNSRDNFLNKKGWTILRYSTKQLDEINNCVNEIKESVNNCGGLMTTENAIRYMETKGKTGGSQTELFLLHDDI